MNVIRTDVVTIPPFFSYLYLAISLPETFFFPWLRGRRVTDGHGLCCPGDSVAPFPSRAAGEEEKGKTLVPNKFFLVSFLSLQKIH